MAGTSAEGPLPPELEAPVRTVVFPPLISVLILFIILESTMTVNARELRPADHGLEYYNKPGESSSEMTSSFFGPPSLNEFTSTSSSSTAYASALPSAVKSPVASSSKDRDDDDDNQVMSHMLVVGSLVCGLTGVAALMVASALIYFRGYQKMQNSSVNCDQIHDNTK